MSAAVIHVVSFIINPDPRLLASAPLLLTALRRRNWPLETRPWCSQLSSQPAGSFSSQLTVFSIYIIYNRPLQSTQANGIANTTQTPQLEPHLSLTLNLPHSLVARLPQVPKLEIPQTPKEVSKILFAQRAATDEYWKESIVWNWWHNDTSPLVTVVPLQIQVKDWPL